MIARHLHPYFWDIDLQTFEPQSYPEYTIGRILEYGDEAAVSWLKQNFTRDQIVAVIRNDRRLSRRSAKFWALAYSVPPDETAALKPDCPQDHCGDAEVAEGCTLSPGIWKLFQPARSKR